MGGQVVHDDDVARTQGRGQHLLAPGPEGLAVHRSIEQQGSDEAGQGQAADEGHGLPVSVRDRGPAALAFRRPATQAGHLGRQSAFVDEDQALRIELGLVIEPLLAGGPYVRAALLGGVRGLFLCVWS